jgi:hypothetical protein
MKYIVAEFIPIIIIFLLLSRFKDVVKFSHTILGKLIVLCTIIFYTCLDKFIGLFVCGLFILYYQSDNVEQMLNMEDLGVDFDLDSDIKMNVDELDLIDDGVYLDSVQIKRKTNKENMVDYNSLYAKDAINTMGTEDVLDEFRKKACDKGVLKYKNMNVNKEMAEHVYPEVEFNGRSCNPCDETCDISIINNKINTEEKLLVRIL